MGSTFGQLFRITTFGESHGPASGVVIEGCPPRIALDLSAIESELARRRPGTSLLSSQRKESDRPEFLSGLLDGVTLGTPIAMLIRNEDADASAYASLRHVYRPSHADFTWDAKYGIRAHAGGGRASARETAARVAAGAVARQVLRSLQTRHPPAEIIAWVDAVGADRADIDPAMVSSADVYASDVRCPDPEAAARFTSAILAARRDGDTVGGVIRCVARGIPAGLGEPVFDKLDADLAKAMLSLPAAKGFEVGSGYAGTKLRGTAHNDTFVPDPARGIATSSNYSGGIQGGISNGMPIELSVAFKPVATVFHPVQTVDDRGEPTTLAARGRHDPCVLPRAVPIVEAMVALVLLDHWLRWRGQVGEPPRVPLRAR